MPLPKPEPQRLEIANLGGLELDEDVLYRPQDSWQALTNFDLVKRGSIRKTKAHSKVGVPLPGPVVAIRDYRLTPEDPLIVIAFCDNGKYYNLYTGQFLGDWIGGDPPYVTVLPFLTLSGLITNYMVYTRGIDNRPGKFFNAGFGASFDLGVSNPRDDWDEDYQYSIGCKNGATGYLPVTDNPNHGISIISGRNYTYTYWNAITRHDSSFAQINGAIPEKLAVDDGPSVFMPVRNLRFDKPYISEIPLTFNGPEDGMLPLPKYGTDYGKIRIWATKDGGQQPFLVRHIYNVQGIEITDRDGAIDLHVIRTGQLAHLETQLEQEFVPILDGYESTGSGDWTVNGDGQSGFLLVVNPGTTLPWSEEAIAIDTPIAHFHGDRFTIEGIEGTYTYRSQDPVNTWHISPVLASSPADGAAIVFKTILPTQDYELVATDEDQVEFDENDPPPPAVWGAVYQNKLFFVDARDRSKLVYSKDGEWESFPKNNFFRFLGDELDEITGLITGKQIGMVTEGKDQRLVVGKSRSCAQIIGTNFQDFQQMSFHADTGVVFRRGITVYGGHIFAITKQGFALLEAQLPNFFGKKIQSITDQIITTNEIHGPIGGADSAKGIVLFAIRLSEGSGANDTIVMIDSSRESPFSLLNPLPTDVCCIYESTFVGDRKLITNVLLGGIDGNVYQLFGDTNGVIESVAITQKLPQADKATTKLFQKLFIPEPPPALTWRLWYTVDGNTYGPYTLHRENFIGLVGREIEIQFSSNGVTTDADILGGFILQYVIIASSSR